MFWRSADNSKPTETLPPGAPRLTASSNTAMGRVTLAHALFCDGRYDAALGELAVALDDNPELAEGQLLKGLTLARLERFSAAIGPLTLARELDPELRLASYGLASVYLRLEDYERALAWADVLTEQDAEDPQAHGLRGELLERLGRGDEALAAYSEARRLKPTLAPVRLRLGELLAEREEWEAAHGELEAAVRLAPTEARALQALAGVLIKLGRTTEATAAYRRASQFGQPTADLFLSLAECHLAQAQLFEAVIALRAAVVLDPLHPQAHQVWSRIYAAEGRPAEAEEYELAAARLTHAMAPSASPVAPPRKPLPR